MKKFFLLAIITVLFSACNPSKTTEIKLFNGYSFLLKEDEKVISKSTLKNTYLDYIKNKNTQIPLFKNIKGSEYYIYIGLPLDRSVVELQNSKLFTDIEPLLSNSEKDYSYAQYKKENTYYIEYVNFSEKNKLYILGVTDSVSSLTSILSLEELSNRINKH